MKSKIILMVIMILIHFSLIAQEENVMLNDKYGNILSVSVNPTTGSAHRVYGNFQNINRYGFDTKSLNYMSISSLSEKILADYSEILRINPKQVKMRRAETDGKMWFVEFEQAINEVPVFGTQIGFTIDNEGNIIALGADAYLSLSISTLPQINEQDAKSIVKKDFSFSPYSEEKECKLTIFPQEEKETVVFYLAWKITFRSIQPLKNITYFVDAQSGQIIHKRNNILEGGPYTGQVKGSYYPVHNYDTPSQPTGYKTTYIKVKNSSNQVVQTLNSNANGNFTTNSYTGSYKIEIPLENEWIQVRDAANNNPVTYVSNLTTAPATINKTWSADDGPNVRWHASIMHDYFKNTFSYSGVDYKMEAYINSGPYINGASDGRDIYFGSYNGDNYARSSDYVNHEYAHCAIYRIGFRWIGNGSLESDAMNEGLADYFACTVSDPEDSQWGEDCYSNYTRDLDNSYSWDPTKGAHWNGQVIGGACWDLRESVGQTIADQLVFKALEFSPTPITFEEFLYYVLKADRNMYNGDHAAQIIIAFNNHDIRGTEKSGNIYTTTWANGNYYITSNITIPSGSTLTITGDTYLGFANGARLIVNGNLNIQTGSRVTMSKGTSANWGGIRFNQNSGGTVTNCRISYATTGVYLNHTSSPVIKFTKIYNGSSGSYGIYCNYSSPTISNNTITGTSYPLWFINYSSPSLAHNFISANTYYGMRAENGSNVFWAPHLQMAIIVYSITQVTKYMQCTVLTLWQSTIIGVGLLIITNFIPWLPPLIILIHYLLIQMLA